MNDLTSERPNTEQLSAELPGTTCLSLPPLKKRHERKTFASQTLKMINSRLQYYRKILSQPEPTDKKMKTKYDIIKNKFDRDMKVRLLLNRAVKNLYS